MTMVRKAGRASDAMSHFMRTTLIIIRAPTVTRAGPMAYGGTLAATSQTPPHLHGLSNMRVPTFTKAGPFAYGGVLTAPARHPLTPVASTT